MPVGFQGAVVENAAGVCVLEKGETLALFRNSQHDLTNLCITRHILLCQELGVEWRERFALVSGHNFIKRSLNGSLGAATVTRELV